MIEFKFTAAQADTLRTAVEYRQAEDDDGLSPFFSPGGLPPKAPEEPAYVRTVRAQVPQVGTSEAELAVPVDVLAELVRSLEHYRNVLGRDDANLESTISCLAPPRIARGMVQKLAGHVAHYGRGADRVRLFQLIDAVPPQDPAQDGTILELKLAQANGTLSGLSFVEEVARRWPDIDRDLRIDAAWEPPGSRWVGARPRS